MAKIHDLTVDTINIADAAILGTAESTSPGAGSISVDVDNPLLFPVLVHAVAVIQWQLFVSGGGVLFTIAVTRGSDGTGFDLKSFGTAAIGSGARNVSTSIFDPKGAEEETYTLSATAQHNPGPNNDTGFATIGFKTIRAMYRKR